MSITYAPSTNFGAKDSLPTNDSDKVIRGSEFTTEFTAIQTAFSLAAPAASPTFTGTVTIPTADINGGNIDGTVIGAATPAAGSFTTGQFGTSLNVDGTVTADGLSVDGTGVIRLDDTTVYSGNTASVDQLKIQNLDTTTAYTPAVMDFTARGATTTSSVWQIGNAGLNSAYAESNFFFKNRTAASTYAQRFLIAGNGDISFYEDTGTTPKFFWDASAESLGIGTSSPQELLHLSATTPVFRLEGGSRSYQQFVSGTDFVIRDVTATANRITLNSSGNVGIGTSSPSSGISGSSAVVEVAHSNLASVVLNNTSADSWEIASSVGSDLLFNNGTTRAVIDSSGNLLVGTTTSPSDTGTIVADGVYLGGTGAANLLDDYEEGTWTPAFSFSTSGSVTYSDTTGTYTKVGRMVCVSCSLVVSSISSPTGNVSITGLPFTSATTGAVASAAIGGARNFVNSGLTLRVYNNPNSTSFVVATNDTDAGHAWLQGSNFTASTTLFITATYFV